MTGLIQQARDIAQLGAALERERAESRTTFAAELEKFRWLAPKRPLPPDNVEAQMANNPND